MEKDTRTCSRCKKDKLYSEFFQSTHQCKDGYSSWCKSCCREKGKEYYKTHKKEKRLWGYKYRDRAKKQRKDHHYKKNYGIDSDRVEVIREEQKDLCAICGKPEKTKNQHGKISLSVDHNHKTGQVRGLLCGDCNRALGGFNVDVFGTLNLEMAIEYIKSAQEKNKKRNKEI